MKLAAIIPSSGKSLRMGQPKSLLRIEGKTLIAWQTASLRNSNIDPVIIVGHARLKPHIPSEAIFVDSHDQPREMIESIRLGIAQLPPDTEGILIVPADFPLLDNSIVSLLVSAFASNKNKILAPVFNDKRGHPVLVPNLFFGEVLTSFGGEGLRGLIKKYPQRILEIESDSDVIHINLNTPADVVRFERDWKGRRG